MAEAKLSSFGIPEINLRWTSQSRLTVGTVPLTQITKAYDAVFGTEQEANDYEKVVLSQMQAAMEHLRNSHDDFSSSYEGEL